MAFLSKAAKRLPLIALIATAVLGVPHAGAANLFDVLFGGGIKQKPAKRGDFPQAPPAVRKQVPIARISGPSYYTYKADALMRVDFTKLGPATTASIEPVAFDPSGDSEAFGQALSALDGFELFAEKDVSKALLDHYGAKKAFIWVADNAPNARAQAALRVLGEADSYGLVASDYGVAVPAGAATDTPQRRAEMMRFEMVLSARVLRYVRDANRGRVDPNRISGYHDFPEKPLDLAAVMTNLAGAGDARAYLESFHPQNAEYKALRVELESLKASAENEIVVDPKLLLKPGETSAELPKLVKLIARDLDDEMGGDFGEVLWKQASSEVYTPELVEAVKAKQKQVGLKSDGVVGPRTVAALAGVSKADRIEKVVIALEQLRWLPSDLGSTRVFVNQPAFSATYIENGAEKISMRVVVGAPSTQTAFFYDKIKQVDYNPYWGVPQSIIVNEMLPRLRRDPGYLDRAGYEVTDAKGRRIPSSAVAWGSYGSKIPYNVRQVPSEDNALGELKILFPNKHAIYMHDTPSKSLFQRDVRALSHGCVRLQDPRGMAAAVLGQSLDYVAGKLKQGHSSEQVTRNIPVYMAYFTAWPTLSGKVEYFTDVYSRDTHVEQAIEKTDQVRAPSA